MVRKYNPPVVFNVYAGSGKYGEKIRININKCLKPRQSVSEFVMDALRETHPEIFKGAEDGK